MRDQQLPYNFRCLSAEEEVTINSAWYAAYRGMELNILDDLTVSLEALNRASAFWGSLQQRIDNYLYLNTIAGVQARQNSARSYPLQNEQDFSLVQ